MRLFLIFFCISVARPAVSYPSAEELTTLTTDTSSAVNISDAVTENGRMDSTVNETISSSSDSSSSDLTDGSLTNSSESAVNVTIVPLSNSTEPHCKSDEKLIEDATSCHVLCSKGALFYYSAGRKPNGTECVINKYLEGTKHIESTDVGDCFKGQCRQRNGTSTSTESTTTIGSTILTTDSSNSSQSSTVDISETPENEQTSTVAPSSPLPTTSAAT